MAITIKNIAAEAGVSYQAVSAVLNNKTNCRVSPAKREHILDIAKKLGYKVNFGYKLMQGKSTHTVGIVVAMRQIESEEHIRALVVKLMQKLNKMGFATYFNNMMTKDAEHNHQEILDLITRGVEHFIFIGSPVGHEQIEEELIKNNCTFVGWNSYFSRDLQNDSFSATEELIKFLYEKSGEFPKLIIPQKYTHTVRFKAFEKVLKEIYPEAMTANYLILTDELQWSENDFVAKAYALGYKAAKDAFTNGPAPKAIACFTDTFALGVVAYCHEHNIVIGKDIFISGFNNIEAVKYNPYPIASATHPIDESMEILLEQMDKKDPFKQTIPLKVNLRSI